MLYIAYYTTSDDARISSPAANEKIKSISKAIGENGIPVKILSTCTVASKGRFIRGRKFNLFKNVTCKQYPLFNTSFGPFRRLQYIWASIKIFFTLLFCVKKGENVLFYHAIERIPPIKLAKKIKKFRLILEVEEIYANARKLKEREVKRERQIFEMADAYIFPTELLNKKINEENKPYCVIHGTYEPRPILAEPLKDKVHVVYAGTLDATKGGAGLAVESAKFLDKGFHVHILGFGEDYLVKDIKDKIFECSSKTDCTVTYDGCLSGDEYTTFLQKCHVGLSTQNVDGKFNDTSFPSKILTYMANGLKVVTGRIPVVETSAVNDNVFYYDEQSPEKIAQAIKDAVTSNVCDGRQKLLKLREEFKKDVTKVLEK